MNLSYHTRPSSTIHVIRKRVIEQNIGKRPDHTQPRRFARRREANMPRRERRIERAARQARMKRAIRRLEPHIMAHPDIMDEIAAIAELHHLPHQPRRGEMIAIVRSEERRVGKECVSTCRSRWSPYHEKKKH